MEVAMNKSMSSHLIIAKVVAKKCQLGREVFEHMRIYALHVNHTIDAIHPSVVFEKVDDGSPNIEKNNEGLG